MKQGEAIESRLLSRQIERAQRKVEAHNFDVRKQLLEYDDVANDQRKVVYQQRTELMEADEIADAIVNIRDEVVADIVAEYIPPQSVEELWDTDGLTKALEREFGLHMDITGMVEADDKLTEQAIHERVLEAVVAEYDKKTESVGERVMRMLEKQIMLRQLDSHWKEHIGALEYLRQGIGLRSFAQRNPKQEYKREAFEMFSDMLDRVKRDTITILSKIQIQRPDDVGAVAPAAPAPSQLSFQHAAAPSLAAQTPDRPPAPVVAPGRVAAPGAARPQAAEAPPEPFVRDKPKVGRNQPCPCGSGKKYKQCHGRLS
ncbi:MAG: SEC-C metal-binding domain-containing protein, partial [Gammaproteobacteria bacterium]|nr:SEC-C metal-binding domain-containing protein [Gammaproteobacteria bacterium]